jgi:hypothetical protein
MAIAVVGLLGLTLLAAVPTVAANSQTWENCGTNLVWRVCVRMTLSNVHINDSSCTGTKPGSNYGCYFWDASASATLTPVTPLVAVKTVHVDLKNHDGQHKTCDTNVSGQCSISFPATDTHWCQIGGTLGNNGQAFATMDGARIADTGSRNLGCL